MPIPNQDPKKGPKPQTWTFDKVRGGRKFVAYKAGNWVGVNVHCNPVSKPCRETFTNGALACPMCSVVRLDWLGYQPLYGVDGKRIVVGIREHSREMVKAIPLYSPVQVSRVDGEYEAVCVEQLPRGEKMPKPKDAPLTGADISDWLLRVLWGDRVLLEWWEQQLDQEAREILATAPTCEAYGAKLPKDKARPATPSDVAYDRLKARLEEKKRGLASIDEILPPPANGKPH